MKEKGKVVTICGSMKYSEAMIAIAQTLTAGGNVVLFPFEIPNSPIDLDKAYIDNYKEELCWDVHKQRIEMSDTIYVVNIDGYIGNHTKKNIEFAQLLQKQIIYHEHVDTDDSIDPVKIKDEIEASFNMKISEYLHKNKPNGDVASEEDMRVWNKVEEAIDKARRSIFSLPSREE